MKLAEIPQILGLLQEKEIITEDQKNGVLAGLDKAKEQGKTAFAGEMGIGLGFYDQNTLNETLKEQTVRKAEAAVEDIQEISKSGKQEAPVWLKANWGNNGVNPAPQEPTIADGVSAAANIAQNITMIANEKPEIAKELIQAVSASANLARGIADGSTSRVPLDKKSQEWIKESKQGLIDAIEKSGHKPTDRNGEAIKIEKFISERFKEVEKGVELSLSRGHGGQGANLQR